MEKLNDPENCWIRCLTVFGCMAVMSIASCTSYSNKLEQEAVIKSQNPAATECAFSNSDRQHTAFCVEAARSLSKQPEKSS
jgi:hypothetical protein